MTVNGDQELLRRVLVHLLSNAMKFTNEGDVINVDVSACDVDGLRIEICDTGAGVSEAHLVKLSDPFYQADSSRSRSHDGAGLGLYLAKKYVELHSGALSVNGGAKLVHPGGAKLVHLTLCGTRCWGVVPVVHRREPRCFV